MRPMQKSLSIVAILGIALGASAEPPAAESDRSPKLISQKQKTFQPMEITIQKGEELLFRNDDPVTHNVFSRTKGSQFNLKMQAPGQEDVVRFDVPGEVTVRCAIHPTMKLTVHVEGE